MCLLGGDGQLLCLVESIGVLARETIPVVPSSSATTTSNFRNTRGPLHVRMKQVRAERIFSNKPKTCVGGEWYPWQSTFERYLSMQITVAY